MIKEVVFEAYILILRNSNDLILHIPGPWRRQREQRGDGQCLVHSLRHGTTSGALCQPPLAAAAVHSWASLHSPWLWKGSNCELY